MSNLSEKAIQNKVEYNTNRVKELRAKKIIKQFNSTLPYNEVEEINKFLKENNISKADLIRFGYKKLKEEK